jgi:hypothetical protein
MLLRCLTGCYGAWIRQRSWARGTITKRAIGMRPPISKLANSSYATGDPNFGMDRILGQLQIKLQFVSAGVVSEA